jgi:hypothetical protein
MRACAADTQGCKQNASVHAESEFQVRTHSLVIAHDVVDVGTRKNLVAVAQNSVIVSGVSKRAGHGAGILELVADCTRHVHSKQSFLHTIPAQRGIAKVYHEKYKRNVA